MECAMFLIPTNPTYLHLNNRFCGGGGAAAVIITTAVVAAITLGNVPFSGWTILDAQEDRETPDFFLEKLI